MAINKVGSKGILDGSVAAADFGAGAITNDKLAGSIANAKLSNSSITASGTSIALGASGTLNNEFVEWQSVITGNTTMVAGRGYFVNTTSGAISMTLPASATIGDLVVIKDYAGTFATNNLIILRNSHKIQGISDDSRIKTNRASVVLIYVDATKGWLYRDEHNVADLQKDEFITATGGTVATSGNFKIHSFIGDGNFVVSQVGAGSGPSNVDYRVVAGGGAAGSTCVGGAAYYSGGGGAGGHRTTFPSPGCNAGAFPIAVATYPITVGAGGTFNPSGNPGNKGSNSVFSTITSTGGGGGAEGGDGSSSGVGQPGGSGGGGSFANPGPTGSAKGAGSGNTPPVSPSQGNNGGVGGGTRGNTVGAGGGGGGAGGVGANSPTPTPGTDGGAGGNGTANSITGSSVTLAGGGGGNGPSNGGSGGPGGGGNGGNTNGGPGTAGTANTGGGGGGYYAGGKGIVIIRYKFQ